jgi:hypothetical protein
MRWSASVLAVPSASVRGFGTECFLHWRHSGMLGFFTFTQFGDVPAR